MMKQRRARRARANKTLPCIHMGAVVAREPANDPMSIVLDFGRIVACASVLCSLRLSETERFRMLSHSRVAVLVQKGVV